MSKQTTINETAITNKTININQKTKERKKMCNGKRAAANRQVISTVLMAAIVAAFISGILIRPLGDSVVMLALHKLSSLVLVISTIFHVLQYKKKKEVTHVS